ncbi:hypothetical protein INS49_005017 [Diaporthe citri]|uniref:uncharacterized protein n=1 Tax=Diaporthe citri TaxID=83186 RepID=UPI001C7E4E61|nr:uncharacterized protein INS49_005017 [Diaporthe citri]KAG6354046.1 hypothetical protein INS49_005017 [Diaporthe citri]
MASTTIARALTIGILLSCAAFGAYGTFGAGVGNGLFEALQRSAGYEAKEKGFLGGPTPYKTTYTGIRLIDNHLVVLNAFFVLIIDGPKTWDVTIAYWCLMAEFCAAWVFIRIEGHRSANQHGRIVNWTGTFGVLIQNITFTVTTPIYFIIYLLTSPAARSNPTPDDLAVNYGDTELLPHRTALSFIIPAALMSLPSPSVLSAGAHYTWLSIWQIFPVAHTFYHFLHWFGYGLLVQVALPGDILESKRKDRDALIRAQRFALYLCSIPRALAMAVALTPAALAPEALRPVFEQVTLGSLLVPYWPWNSPVGGDPASPAGKAELAKLFLQWDVACGGLAILAWASFVYLVAVPNKGLLRDVVPKVLTYGLVGGPVAAATVLVMERDTAVLGPSAKGKKE